MSKSLPILGSEGAYKDAHIKKRGSPDVSVIMAAYNAGNTIVEAVQSVLNQSFENIELIICNDASPDGTLQILGKINDPRVIIISNKENLGPGKSRDAAIHAAGAPWIAFIDSDDAWEPCRLERMLGAISEIECDLMFDNTMLCHHSPKGLVPWKPLHGSSAFGTHGNQVRRISVEDYIVCDRLLMHPIFKAELIKRNNIYHTSRRFAEDAEFYLRLAYHGARLLYFPEPMYYYRITPGSLTVQTKDKSAMRLCLQECSEWPGWSPSACGAFDEKIDKLKKFEDYYILTNKIKNFQFISAMKFFISRPHLLLTLPRRIAHQIQYHGHRIISQGQRR